MPVIIDPEGESIAKLRPDIVVDAIIAKEKSWNFYGHGTACYRSWSGIYGWGRC